MGDYTGFRTKVTVKPECRELITALHDEHDWAAVLGAAERIKADSNLIKAVSIWGYLFRSGFIPFGMHCYIPEDWGDSFSRYDEKSGVWEFSCSLKNYENEIETFMNDLFPLLIESCTYCEKLSEYWSESKFYEFSRGAFVKKEKAVPFRPRLFRKLIKKETEENEKGI